MKFNCKKIVTEKELERRITERRHELEAIADDIIERKWQEALQKREWHRKFLWWPMAINDYECRWLEFIEVRYPNARGPGKWVKYGDYYNCIPYSMSHCGLYGRNDIHKMSIKWSIHDGSRLGEPEYRVIGERE